MMRLRQVALVARDLERALDDIRFVLDIEVSFRDPAVAMFGLRNGVMPVGDTFLEVISPLVENCSGARYLERRKGDGGYMVIVQTDDLDAARARLDAAKLRTVLDHASGRMATLHVHPRDTGGTLLSIDSADPPQEWDWAGPDWRASVRTKRCARIAGVEIQCADPADVASRWARALALEVVRRPQALEIIAEQSLIRFTDFRDERGEGLHTILLVCNDRESVTAAAKERGLCRASDSVELAGTEFRLL